MRISLIGMSNIGKTSCARRLAAEGGCCHIDCDALIEDRLEKEPSSRQYGGIAAVADWMGLPSSPQYKKNSDLYLTHEKAVMREALDLLAKEPNLSAIIDTTGSVIYTGDDILDELRAQTRIVYLEATDAQVEALFGYFMTNPKPVIWNAHYAPVSGETPQQTLQRCYPELLRSRAKRYKEIAHVTIPVQEILDHSENLSELFLEKLAPAGRKL